MFAVLLASASFSEALNEKEWAAYNDLSTTTMNDIIDNNPPDSVTYLDSVMEKVGKKHGLSFDQMNDIYLLAPLEMNPSKKELDMARDFWRKFNSLPSSSIRQDRLRVLKEVADSYGASTEKVKEWAFRTM